MLTDTHLVRPVHITFRLRSFRPPSALPAASQASAVWLASYNARTQQWQPVASTYDPATRTVTAQVRHLSWWAPWTWDWQQIALRLRRSLSALGSGRAALSPCPGVHGVTVTSSGGQDPPLIGCAAQNGANALTVSLTGNRSYAMVVHAPAGAVLEPPSYNGFDEWIQTRDATTNVLGGPYLAVTHTVSYDLPLHGGPVTFTAAASWKTHVVDQAAPAAEAVFDLVTLGYAHCILDSVARSEPASFADAPGLIVECFPVLAEATTLLRFYLKYLEPVSHYVQSLLEAYDRAHDTSLGISGKVYIGRPAAAVTPEFYVHNGYELGSLYKYPNFPARVALNNGAYLSGLQWTQVGVNSGTATGTLNVNNCVPSCAGGTYVQYSVRLLASDPQQCTVAVYRPYSTTSKQVRAYVFNQIQVTALSGNPPSVYVGTSPVDLPPACG